MKLIYNKDISELKLLLHNFQEEFFVLHHLKSHKTLIKMFQLKKYPVDKILFKLFCDKKHKKFPYKQKFRRGNFIGF